LRVSGYAAPILYVSFVPSVTNPPVARKLNPLLHEEVEEVGVVATTGGAWVLAEAEADCAEVLFDASYAETVYEYAVEAVRAVLEYEVPAVVAIWVPLRYMRYPLTPTLSVEAVQERLIWVEEMDVAERPEGTEGAEVSGVGAGGGVPPERAALYAAKFTPWSVPSEAAPFAGLPDWRV